MGKTQITADPGVQQIEMTREFKAPREVLLRAYTEPDLIAQWLGPRGYEMIIDRFEVRDGGRWRYTHRDGDGNDYSFHGVFHGTPSVDGIVQTFEYEGTPGQVCLESLAFEERGDTTLVRTRSVFQSVADRDAMIESGMETGVEDGYERLEELLPNLLAVR